MTYETGELGVRLMLTAALKACDMRKAHWLFFTLLLKGHVKDFGSEVNMCVEMYWRAIAAICMVLQSPARQEFANSQTQTSVA